MNEAIHRTRGGAAAVAFRITMGLGLLLTLAANVPGQLSLDSLVALSEARTGVRQTWAPPAFSWILKLFDSVAAGTGLYVTVSSALLFVSLMSLTRLRPRATWVAVVLGAAVVLTPQLVLYQGIVWRDVLFANLSITGFVCLADAARRWSARPLLPVAGALVCLVLASLLRQNGLILLVAGAGVLAWTARESGRRASLAWGLGFLVLAAILAAGLNALATPPESAPKLRQNASFLILEHYDIVGAKAHHPKLKMKVIGKADPAARALLEGQAMRVYSAARVDTLDLDETYRKTLWHVPDAVMNAQWRAVILNYPAAYILHRADAFRWVFLTPDLQACLPVQVGVVGPDALLTDIGMQTGVDPQDKGLADYARHFFGTPVYSHLTWALAALAAIGLLLRRRDAADMAIIGLLGGALAFAASFAVISVACDYRYLYLLDLAGMVGVLYVALDPPWKRRA